LGHSDLTRSKEIVNSLTPKVFSRKLAALLVWGDLDFHKRSGVQANLGGSQDLKRRRGSCSTRKLGLRTWEIAGNRVREDWSDWNTLGILQQLGVQRVAAAGTGGSRP